MLLGVYIHYTLRCRGNRVSEWTIIPGVVLPYVFCGYFKLANAFVRALRDRYEPSKHVQRTSIHRVVLIHYYIRGITHSGHFCVTGTIGASQLRKYHSVRKCKEPFIFVFILEPSLCFRAEWRAISEQGTKTHANGNAKLKSFFSNVWL